MTRTTAPHSRNSGMIGAGLFLLVLALLLAGAPGKLLAQPTVDGRFYGGGDYQYYVPFATSAGGSVLHYTVADNRLYVALVVDRSVNDNVFDRGPGSATAYMTSAGWGGHRTARRLIDSEFAEFTLDIGGQSWTWKQGYAGQPGVNSQNSNNTLATWISDHTVSGGEGTPPPGLQSASSMSWNMNRYASRLNDPVTIRAGPWVLRLTPTAGNRRFWPARRTT